MRAFKTKIHKRPTFRSGLEQRVSKELTSRSVDYLYEPQHLKIAYTIPASDHKYTPDFFIVTDSGKEIFVETKGIWDYDDRYKHLLIRQQEPDLDIRFVFSRSKQPIRKGSKTTYADICKGLGRGAFKGVEWKFADKSVPYGWLKE